VAFHTDDGSSPTAHWRLAADAALIPVLSESVVAFATDRGLSPDVEGDLRRALGRVLRCVLAETHPEEPAASVLIDAAADGLWLAVRITHAGVRRAVGAGSRDELRRLTDRVEIDTSGAAPASLLMEFAMSRPR
jgi:hypothetical protein